MKAADYILITGLEFHGYHGVPDAEQEIGHRYCADLQLMVDTRRAGASDKMTDTIDYGAVAAQVVKIAGGERCRLVEALAARIVETLFHCYPQIEGIRLRLIKRLPPVNIMAESVGVEICRMRSEDGSIVPAILQQPHAHGNQLDCTKVFQTKTVP